MKRRYSVWLEELVYDMTEEQEQYLVKMGLNIIKPELVNHNDGIIRDIPHYIEPCSEFPHLKYNSKRGEFYINVNKKWCYAIEEAKTIRDKLDELMEILQEVQKLGGK